MVNLYAHAVFEQLELYLKLKDIAYQNYLIP